MSLGPWRGLSETPVSTPMPSSSWTEGTQTNQQPHVVACTSMCDGPGGLCLSGLPQLIPWTDPTHHRSSSASPPQDSVSPCPTLLPACDTSSCGSHSSPECPARLGHTQPQQDNWVGTSLPSPHSGLTPEKLTSVIEGLECGTQHLFCRVASPCWASPGKELPAKELLGSIECSSFTSCPQLGTDTPWDRYSPRLASCPRFLQLHRCASSSDLGGSLGQWGRSPGSPAGWALGQPPRLGD